MCGSPARESTGRETFQRPFPSRAVSNARTVGPERMNVTPHKEAPRRTGALQDSIRTYRRRSTVTQLVTALPPTLKLTPISGCLFVSVAPMA